MHPANTAGGLYKGIPSSSEEQAETMRRYTELSDQLSKDLNARGATAGMYDEAMLALGGTDVPSMRKALEEDLTFQKMGGIENFLKRADQYASYGKDLSTSPYRQNLVFLGRLRPDLDYINREQFARQGSGTAGYSAQMFADGGPVSSDFGPDDLQQQLLELDRQAMEQDVRSAAQAPSDTDQETRTESRGMLERLNQNLFERVTKPVLGSALDMTVGLGDLAQLGVKKGAEALGMETKPFVPVSQRLQQAR
jgi:hypothetical protein